jgi:hypothetical protein
MTDEDHHPPGGIRQGGDLSRATKPQLDAYGAALLAQVDAEDTTLAERHQLHQELRAALYAYDQHMKRYAGRHREKRRWRIKTATYHRMLVLAKQRNAAKIATLQARRWEGAKRKELGDLLQLVAKIGRGESEAAEVAAGWLEEHYPGWRDWEEGEG